MKAVGACVLLAFFASATASSGGGALSPVTRVVELLQALSKKIGQEAEKEENLYETYQCWAKTVIDSKTATNAAAESRIESLSNYIADIDAGRVEFTTERVDLEKELEQLNAELEAAADLRKQQNDDFLDAEDEMTKAIDALSEAGAVLESATTGKKGGKQALLTMKSHLNEGFAARAAEAATLNHAVQLGQKFLTKGDALFLRRILTGEVPKPDWKKLNRKATFKKGYEHRSGKIQDILAKLLETFNSNLKDARAKEAEALSQYDTLKEAKEGQRTAAEEALSKMDKENGAAGLTRSDAEAEVDSLTTQVTDDKKYIQQVKDSSALKKEEWKDRQVLRAGELEAIGKAVSILHSDDNRDLMKRSFKSQGFFFLQVDQSKAATAHAKLREVARKSHDRRVAVLAAPLSDVTAGSHFDKVIAAIDNMVQTLQDEEKEDLQKKEVCEQDRMTDTRTASLASRAIDEMTDFITKATEEIAEMEAEIVEKRATIKQITEEINEAERIRNDEHTEWASSDADDEDAGTVVGSAIGVLETFYKESGLMSLAQQPKVVAGEAPPPPPTTWEAPYGGKTGMSTGIIMIMQMIKDDIEADRTKAKASEDKSKSDFDTAYGEYETQRDLLLQAISDLQGDKADKVGEVESTKESRRTEKGGLDTVMTRIKNAEPGCNFATVNFGIRSSNRQIEIDGLVKAKAILQGAAFSAPADENREMKPGDALLQRSRRRA